MVDFHNSVIFKLSEDKSGACAQGVGDLLVPEENVIGCYKAMRDYVVFTDMRVISVNVQGITGKKKTSRPCRIQRSACFRSRRPACLISTASSRCTSADLARFILSFPATATSKPSARPSPGIFSNKVSNPDTGGYHG